MTDEEYDELFFTQKTKQNEPQDIYDELFNPQPPKQPQLNDISLTRSVESSMWELRQRLTIINE